MKVGDVGGAGDGAFWATRWVAPSVAAKTTASASANDHLLRMEPTLQDEPLDARLRSMVARRTTILVMAGVAMLTAFAAARADDLKVLETNPVANGTLDKRSDGFFVRFNQPVDHVNSRLVIKRGNDVVETLQPRLQSDPNVLFARAAGLPDGQYVMHWYVKTLAGAKVEQGDVPFSVTTPK
jgi:hypothetical protein